MNTERLYYHDPYLTEFDAAVVRSADDGRRIYLTRTAFYPTSGGQPFDIGELGGRRVVDVIDEDHAIAHVLDAPLLDATAHGTVDWTRRFDHMQQHTGQHLLSAVFAEKAGLETLSFHLGAAVSTIDLDTPSLDPALLEEIEREANTEIVRNRPIVVSFEEAAEVQGLRKPPARTGMLRIVSIEGLDRSACGGTHVRATGEIGSLRLLRTEKVRQSTRVEFVCGMRALNFLRVESAEQRAQAAALQSKIAQLEKERRKLATELAVYRGRELYQQAEPNGNGLRYVVRRLPEIDESVRAEAQAFVQGSRAAYLAAGAGSLLLAVSADSALHAGALIKPIVSRGGGSATMAQGSCANVEDAIAKLQLALAP